MLWGRDSHPEYRRAGGQGASVHAVLQLRAVLPEPGEFDERALSASGGGGADDCGYGAGWLSRVSHGKYRDYCRGAAVGRLSHGDGGEVAFVGDEGGAGA